jgi:hypothetical protein
MRRTAVSAVHGAKGISLTTVNCTDDIPDFQTEDDEAAFWATHRFGDELLERMGPALPDALPPGFEQQERPTRALPRASQIRQSKC